MLLDLGAFIHPRLKISYSNGNFSCHCHKSREGEILIKLPTSCLIRVDDYQLSLQGMQLNATAVNKQLNTKQKELMRLTMQLYNVSGKIDFIRENSLIIKLGCEHIIYQHLNKHQSEKAYVKTDKELYQANEIDELTIQSFLRTRTFNESKTSMGRVIMPLIDLFNHHSNGAAFQNKLHKPDSPYLSIKASHSDKTTDQCYACYGNTKDSMHLYNIYHYTDTQTPFLYSVPLVLDLEGLGKIKIQRSPHRKKQSKHPLANQLPSHTSCTEGVLTISDILISSDGYPPALRLVLNLLIKKLSPKIQTQQLEDAVITAETILLDTNTKYYNKLIELLPKKERLPIHQTLESLAFHQLKIIEKYQLNLG